MRPQQCISRRSESVSYVLWFISITFLVVHISSIALSGHPCCDDRHVPPSLSEKQSTTDFSMFLGQSSVQHCPNTQTPFFPHPPIPMIPLTVCLQDIPKTNAHLTATQRANPYFRTLIFSQNSLLPIFLKAIHKNCEAIPLFSSRLINL